VILQQFLRFPVTRPISLALIREDFPVNNNAPLSAISLNSNNNYSSIINNNNNNSSPPSNGSSTKYSPNVSPVLSSPKQQQQHLSQHHSSDKLSSLGIQRKSPLQFHSSGLPTSLPAGVASSSPNNQGESIISMHTKLRLPFVSWNTLL
jgi:hypothetical protein